MVSTLGKPFSVFMGDKYQRKITKSSSHSVVSNSRTPFCLFETVSKLGTLPLTMLLNKYGQESLSCSFERVVSNLGTLWLTSLFIMDESALGGYKYGQSGGFIWSGSGLKL